MRTPGAGSGPRHRPAVAADFERSQPSVYEDPKFYLTTPIYYVNAAPHIGHTYTTIAADLVKHYKAMSGYDVVLTTGTNKHGQKIERAAKHVGKTPASVR